MNTPRILFTSLSSKRFLFRSVEKQAFKFHPQAKVLASDSDPTCGDRNQIDSFITTPLTDKWKTVDLLNFCQKHQITHVIPTRDGELKFWAKNQGFLRK